MKTYRTVAFNPTTGEKEASETVARQLGEAINRGAAQGWTFEDYETVQVTVSHGCLAALAGRGTSVLTYGVVIFSREAG